MWICDGFYQVDTGGSQQRLDGQEIRVAFETPIPRGFDTREQELAAAKDHIRTQFARIGVSQTEGRLKVTRTVP